MIKLSKPAKKYYNNIKTLTPSRGKYEQKFLKDYRERITELQEEKPDITYECQAETLGDPAEIIREYYSNIDIDYLIKRLRTTRLIRTCIYIFLLLTIIGYLTIVGYHTKLYHDSSKDIPIYKEIIIK